jgi:hypothetical protein
MKTHLIHRLALLLVPLLVLSGCGQAQNDERAFPAAVNATESFQDFGDHVVHFRAFRSDELSPEVARNYGITRSQNRALLNVSIIRKEEGTLGTPVRGTVVAEAQNIVGQHKNIRMREVADETAIYYIGETSISNGETLVFSVEVTTESDAEPLSLRFRQQFYTN